MALPIILRNACKFKGSSLQLNASKFASLAAISNNFPAIQSSKYSVLSRQNNNYIVNSIALSKQDISPSHVRLMSAGADHSKLWCIEKGVSAALIALVPAAVAFPNPVFDNLLAVSVVAHVHWGLEACIADYIRPILFGNVAPKIAMILLYIVTATTLGGLIYLNVNDIGIGKTVRKFWAIKAA